MAARKKAAPKAEEDRTVEEPTTDEVYAGYEPAPVPDRVEVRINGRIVFLDTLHGAHVEVQASGVKVHGSSEAPKSRKSAPEQHFYNPEQDEPGPGGSQMAPVPTPDPELTEELDASATPEDDEASE